MKKTLLATVAAAALFAGSGLAMAQGAAKEGGANGGAAEMNRGGASEMHKGGAEMNRGADHKAGAESKGKMETTGQGAGMDTKADGKAGADMKSRSQTEKTGPAEQNKSQAQSKEGPAANKTQAQDNKAAPSNKNQAQDSKQQPASKSAQDMKGRDNKADTKSSTTGQGAATSAQAGGAVNLTSEQKTTIRQNVIAKGGAAKISRSQVNFNISVGTVVPRTVHIVEVPDTIVTIHPAWRGYRYFVVDEQVIIIEPSTLKIIAVLDV